jgi:hypothetical protein
MRSTLAAGRTVGARPACAATTCRSSWTDAWTTRQVRSDCEGTAAERWPRPHRERNRGASRSRTPDPRTTRLTLRIPDRFTCTRGAPGSAGSTGRPRRTGLRIPRRIPRRRTAHACTGGPRTSPRTCLRAARQIEQRPCSGPIAELVNRPVVDLGPRGCHTLGDSASRTSAAVPGRLVDGVGKPRRAENQETAATSCITPFHRRSTALEPRAQARENSETWPDLIQGGPDPINRAQPHRNRKHVTDKPSRGSNEEIRCASAPPPRARP